MKVYSVAILLCCVSSLTCGRVRVSRSNKNGASGKQLGNLAAGLPNLSFQIPAVGLFANSNNGNGINVFGIGGKSTVTRTIVRTVTTVVVPSYRTCTTSAAALMPCAGRRKRSAAPGDEIVPTPSIEIHIGKTKIVDPSAVSEILHLKTPYGYQDEDDEAEDGGITSKSVAATALYPSEDVAGVTAEDELLRAGVTTTLGSVVDDESDDTGVAATTSAVQEQEEEEDDEEESDPARAGLRGAVTTITTTIPVTAIASTPVTVAMSSLTIMYAGCSPPGPLPISTSACV